MEINTNKNINQQTGRSPQETKENQTMQLNNSININNNNSNNRIKLEDPDMFRNSRQSAQDQHKSSNNSDNNGSGLERRRNSLKQDNINKSSMTTTFDGADDEIISIFMNESQDGGARTNQARTNTTTESPGQSDARVSLGPAAADSRAQLVAIDLNQTGAVEPYIESSKNLQDNIDSNGNINNNNNNNNNDEYPYNELNIDLLRQYILVDYEINQLEGKGSLRTYHEKIDQLEQLERELEMISVEADYEGSAMDLGETLSGSEQGNNNNTKGTGGSSKLGQDTDSLASSNFNQSPGGGVAHSSKQPSQRSTTINNSNTDSTTNTIKSNPDHNSNVVANTPGTPTRYSVNNAVDKVYERKLILERERDRLKRDVEQIIIECDKLQQRCKLRDVILDKLFDGRTGNGLENHLEQQLNWLMEQKHYVDQVFYAWKRAETLTSQTCEQFASAQDLLKRLNKITDPNERQELAKSISDLLLKSRQDMEQAQRYNPNVDAPFFTDNETRRFDKVIETISSSTINQSENNQIMTVIRFAYKRAVSIKFWLEQILETTIARDSFELAEEYKWIAIQLRKERINLIKSKLREEPYASMARQILDSLANQNNNSSINGNNNNNLKGLKLEDSNGRLMITDGGEQVLASSDSNQTTNTNTLTDSNETNNTKLSEPKSSTQNQDSGIYSDGNDIDIDEEIYRILEMNRARYLNSNNNTNSQQPNQQQNGPNERNSFPLDSDGSAGAQHQRANGSGRDAGVELASRYPNQQQEDLAREGAPITNSNGLFNSATTDSSANLRMPVTPTKLRIELDEATRRSLLQNVNEAHSQHRDRLERLRGTTRIKVTSSVMNKVQARHKNGHTNNQLGRVSSNNSQQIDQLQSEPDSIYRSNIPVAETKSDALESQGDAKPREETAARKETAVNLPTWDPNEMV